LEQYCCNIVATRNIAIILLQLVGDTSNLMKEEREKEREKEKKRKKK